MNSGKYESAPSGAEEVAIDGKMERDYAEELRTLNRRRGNKVLGGVVNKASAKVHEMIYNLKYFVKETVNKIKKDPKSRGVAALTLAMALSRGVSTTTDAAEKENVPEVSPRYESTAESRADEMWAAVEEELGVEGTGGELSAEEQADAIADEIGAEAANGESDFESRADEIAEGIGAEAVNDGEREMGIYNGYGEKGMWLSEHKTGPYAFADAREVAEVCDNDEVEMIKYTAANQVESFADYMANLPEALQPEGFRGLNLTETEKKLESLSPEEFEGMKTYFDGIMDDALTRRVTLNGTYENALMRMKNANGEATHDNMEVVRCTTGEYGLEVTEFYWVDENGNELGTMLVKMSPVYDEDGNIVSFNKCLQVLNKVGSPVYVNLVEVPPETGDSEEPEPETPVETPNETPSDEPGGPSEEPEPEPEPTPEPTPEVTPTPEPDVTPEPTPEPTPEVTPTPEPEPIPEPEPEVTPTPEPVATPEVTPTPMPEVPPEILPEILPEPEVVLQPKNTEAERENAGPRVTPLELDEDVTPATTLEQDQENFEAIRRQQEEDQRAREEAERVAAEQAEREQQAAVEAEQRRQEEERRRQEQMEEEARRRQEEEDRAWEEIMAEQEAAQAAAEAAANEAAREAEAAAAALQAARAEEERRAAAEAAEREAAQRAADAEAASIASERAAAQQARAQEQASAGVVNPTGQPSASERANRANMFENGDF